VPIKSISVSTLEDYDTMGFWVLLLSLCLRPLLSGWCACTAVLL